MDSLDGRVALVTGASRGIGRAVALALAEKGANVAVNYRARADAASEVVDEIESMGRKATALKADVGDPNESAALVEETAGTFGRLDILVNNAGIWTSGLVDNVDPQTLDGLISTNVKGAFFVTGQAIRHMKEASWGRIINMSSVIGVRGYPGDTMYSATKSAIFGFTKSLAREVARYNITVNAVVPGFIETDMHLEIVEDAREKILKTIPLRRWGKPEEVAGLVAFLAAEGSYVTGQLLAIDGGYTI